ncbi:hypothetical protein [Pseudomonas huaxiensis]|uniref:hypothetical protein n=1 Tax=Pseudomonas huaxiensis TaxID=2213017 RepID=UPI001CDCD61B|nr:hypothetical protein [Pseudomonas huaxiensis]
MKAAGLFERFLGLIFEDWAAALKALITDSGHDPALRSILVLQVGYQWSAYSVWPRSAMLRT